MRSKGIIFVFLFSFFIPVNYLNLISSQLPDFQKTLEFRTASGFPIYLTTFQLWTFHIVSLLCDSLVVAIAVGIVGYYIREMTVYWALLLGLALRYSIWIGLLVYSGGRISSLLGGLELWSYVVISLQVLSTLYFSYLGFNYGRLTEYADIKDKDLFYLCGIPKKIWLLLLITYNVVARFLGRLTIVQIYEVTNKISALNFWKDTFSFSNFFSDDSTRGLTGLLGHMMVICLAWAIAIAVFSFGVNAIRNKDATHRWLRITSSFVLVPGVVAIIPIIRNRTWFF